VSSVRVLRFAAGYATVGVVIAAGTTDIDAALDNDEAVSLVPSAGVVEAVQDYIDDGLRPTTEMCLAVAVATTPVDVTVKVKFKTGTKDTVLAGSDAHPGSSSSSARSSARSTSRAPAGASSTKIPVRDTCSKKTSSR
jgi:hypothetical protein